MKKDSLVKELVDFAKVGEQISHELGAKMIKDHHDKFAGQGEFSYVVGNEILKEMMKQPGCVGFRFFNALNEEGKETMVYVGIDSSGNNLLEITSVNDMGKLAVTEGMVGDRSNQTTNWFS